MRKNDIDAAMIKALPDADNYVLYIDLSQMDIDEAYAWSKLVKKVLPPEKGFVTLPYSSQLDRINKDMLKAWIDLATEGWEKMK